MKVENPTNLEYFLPENSLHFDSQHHQCLGYSFECLLCRLVCCVSMFWQVPLDNYNNFFNEHDDDDDDFDTGAEPIPLHNNTLTCIFLVSSKTKYFKLLPVHNRNIIFFDRMLLQFVLWTNNSSLLVFTSSFQEVSSHKTFGEHLEPIE